MLQPRNCSEAGCLQREMTDLTGFAPVTSRGRSSIALTEPELNPQMFNAMNMCFRRKPCLSYG